MNIDVAQIFIAFIVLLFSLTVHEMAPCVDGGSAGRSDGAAARAVCRWNPLVHADLDRHRRVSRCVAHDHAARRSIGWAKPVPVNTRRLWHPRRDYVLVAAAGPASNLVMAIVAATVLAASACRRR